MTPSRLPRLTDLVMLFLKERFPYWVFRYGESTNNALLDVNGWTYALVYDDSIQLMYDPYWHVPAEENGFIKAANPEFFELLSKHVLNLKQMRKSFP